MIFPPSILRYRKRGIGGRNVNLFIPLVVVWPALAALWVIILPLLLVLAAALCQTRLGRWILLGPPRAFLAFCRLRGLYVSVKKDKRDVLLYLV